MATNKEYIEENLQIDDLEEFFTAIKLGIKISNPDILKQALIDYFKSDNREFHKIVILTDEVKEFLKTKDGKGILVKFRDAISKNNPLIVEFIEKEFPYSKEKNFNFYPIMITENLNEFSINCLQGHVRDLENLIEIITKLTKIDSSKAIKVHYLGQIGVDAGALKRDFITNLFYAASKYWNLNNGILKVENKTLALLGPLLKYVFDSKGTGKISTGEVFHDSFFRGMFEFDQKQISSNSNLSVAEINKILTSGYNEDVKGVLDFLEWNDFSDSETNKAHIETLMKSYINDGLILNPELTSLIGDDVFESSIETLMKLTILNKLPLDDNLINLIGRDEYEALENGSDELKVKFIKDHRIQIEKWIKQDLEIRTMLLKINLRKANLEGLNLDNESMDLINDENYEVKYKFRKDEEKLQAIDLWIKENPFQLQELKNIITDNVLEGFVDQIKNLQIILKSMRFSEKEWLAVKDGGVEAFKVRIQGEFSKEKLLEKIEYRDNIDPVDTDLYPLGTPEYDEALKNATTEFDQATKEHLKKWFNEADEASLKKFAKFVTGSPTIPLNNIKFFIGPSQFEVHACFGQIDVPVGLTEEQIFFYMNMTVADKKGSFDKI